VSKVSQFSFEFDGDLSAPALSVDVSKISGFYEDKLKKKADAIKAVEDARVNKYKKLTEEQHKRAVVIAEKVQNDILKKVNAYRERAENQKIKEYYDDVYKQTVHQSSLINEVVAKSGNISFDDAEIAGFQKQSDAVEAELPKILENLNFVHDQDVRMRVNDRFLEVISKGANLKEYEALFIDVEGAAGEKLANINTKYSLKEDTTAEEYKNKVNGIIEEIAESVDYAKREMGKLKDESDLDIWEDVFDDFEFREENLTARRKELEKVFDEYKVYVEKKVAEEEKKFLQSQGVDTSTPEEKAAVGKISKAGGKTRVIKFSTD
jgi:Skp family chaperone for outer membrane proteins